MGIPRVLCIGGAPMTGKSSVARALAASLGRTVISTDDLSTAVRAVSPPESPLHSIAPANRFAYYAGVSAPQLLDDALKSHREVWPAIRAVVEVHNTWGTPVIVEGWALLPELLVQSFPDCGVWLTVPASVLAERVRSDSAFLAGAPNADAVVAGFSDRSERFGAYLKDTAMRVRLPFLELTGFESPSEVGSVVTSQF